MKKHKAAASVDYGKGNYYIDDIALRDMREGGAAHLELVTRLKRLLDEGDYSPPMLPEVAISLTQLASRPDVDFAQVERVVTRDPAVAAKIVAVANSAFYSRGQPVRSLGAAIARLGLAAVRDVAFQVVAQTSIFRVGEYTGRMRELYKSAQIAGILAREICMTLKFESEMAYLCGLLHDMGEAIVLAMVAAVCKQDGQRLYPLADLQIVVSRLHPQVGATVVAEWGLPGLLCDAVRYHHRYEQSEDPSQMATVIAATDVLLKHIGMGVAREPVTPMSEEVFYKLNLQPRQVTDLLSFAEELVNIDQDLF